MNKKRGSLNESMLLLQPKKNIQAAFQQERTNAQAVTFDRAVLQEATGAYYLLAGQPITRSKLTPSLLRTKEKSKENHFARFPQKIDSSFRKARHNIVTVELDGRRKCLRRICCRTSPRGRRWSSEREGRIYIKKESPAIPHSVRVEFFFFSRSRRRRTRWRRLVIEGSLVARLLIGNILRFRVGEHSQLGMYLGVCLRAKFNVHVS